MTDILVQTRNKGTDYSWLEYDSFKPRYPSESIRSFVGDKQYARSFTEEHDGNHIYKVSLVESIGEMFKQTEVPYKDSQGNPIVNPQDNSLITDTVGRPISVTIVSPTSLADTELDEIIRKTAVEYCTRHR